MGSTARSQRARSRGRLTPGVAAADAVSRDGRHSTWRGGSSGPGPWAAVTAGADAGVGAGAGAGESSSLVLVN